MLERYQIENILKLETEKPGPYASTITALCKTAIKALDDLIARDHHDFDSCERCMARCIVENKKLREVAEAAKRLVPVTVRHGSGVDVTPKPFGWIELQEALAKLEDK